MTTPISQLPTPPQPSDSPVEFDQKAFALLGGLPQFVAEANTLGSEMTALGAETETAAEQAAQSAQAASTSASASAASANSANESKVASGNSAASASDSADKAEKLAPVESATPPINPTPGKQWINTTTGRKYTWFNDGNSSQWVEIEASVLVAVPDAGNEVSKHAILSYETKAQADFAAATLPDGQVLEVEADETRDGIRTRYVVQIGVLVFSGIAGGFVTPYDFGAKGDGVHDDRPAFVLIDAAGLDLYITKPDVKWTLSSPLIMSSASVRCDPTASWSQITDSGKLSWKRGNISTAAVQRLSDRVFIGDAASHAAGNSASGDAGDAWYMNTTDYAGYLGINAQVLSAGGNNYKYVGAAKASDHNSGPIIFGGNVVADVAGRTSWGGIIEMQRSAGMSFGWEISAKNLGSDSRMTPSTKPQGVYGFWLASGGDNLFGGSAQNPSTAAVVVLKNDDQPWNSGIVFQNDSLTDGEAIALSSEGAGGGHRLQWYNNTGNQVFGIRSDATDAIGWDVRRANSGLEIRRAGKTLWNFGSLDSAVNGFNFFPSIAGGTPQINTIGGDVNIDLRLSPKGSGVVRFGVHAASSDTPITGYITIKDNTGALRKLAVIA